MYKNFYTSSDAQIYFSSIDHTKLLKIDTSIELSYTLSQSSTPIYSLGYRKPQFFSGGNTLGQGSITLAFTDEEALKYAISYVTTEQTTTKQYTSTRLGKKTSNADFIKASNDSAFNIDASKRLISIGAIQPLFSIKMFLNNESIIRGSDSKVINLTGVKIINESMPISSERDGILYITYVFFFKDIERG